MFFLIVSGSLNNIDHELQLDDVCFQAPLTMSRRMERLSQHQPQSVGRKDFLKCYLRQTLTDDVKPAIAVVGTLRSSLTRYTGKPYGYV